MVEEKEDGRTVDLEEKCLAVTLVSIHGAELYALMNSDATPNVLSLSIVKRLLLSPEHTEKVVFVADGSRSLVKEKVAAISMSFARLEMEMDFVIMRNVPFDFIIGRPTLKCLGGVLDFKCEEVRLDYRGRQETLPMVSGYSRSQELSDGTNSEDFTSDSDGEEPFEEDEMG